MSDKIIQLTFVRWSNSDNTEMLMTVNKHEHTVLFDKLPKHSQLRFLSWIMNQKWQYKSDDIPNYNGTLDQFDIFTMSPDGRTWDDDNLPLQWHMEKQVSSDILQTCAVCGWQYAPHTPEQLKQERPRLMKSACSEHCGFLLGLRIFGTD